MSPWSLALLVCVLLASPVWSMRSGLRSAVVRARTCDGFCDWQYRVCRESGFDATGCRWRLRSCQIGCMEPSSSEPGRGPGYYPQPGEIPDPDYVTGSPPDLRYTSCRARCKFAILDCHADADTCAKQLRSCFEDCFVGGDQ